MATNGTPLEGNITDGRGDTPVLQKAAEKKTAKTESLEVNTRVLHPSLGYGLANNRSTASNPVQDRPYRSPQPSQLLHM